MSTNQQNFFDTIFNDDGTRVFGNVLKTTTNISTQNVLNIQYNEFSDFVTSEDLPPNLKSDNLDALDLCNYVLYGSAVDFVNQSIQKIVRTFPSSLFITNQFNSQLGNNYECYKYNEYTNQSSFKISTNYIENPFNLNYTSAVSNSTNGGDLNSDYVDRVILVDGKEYPIIGFTPSTTYTNDYIEISVVGKPFEFGEDAKSYHIIPSRSIRDNYFTSLNSFECNLLDNKTTPKYTARLYEDIETDGGGIVRTLVELSLPTNDGYNIDVTSNKFKHYLDRLLSIAKKKDETNSNVICRELVSPFLFRSGTFRTCDGEIEIDNTEFKNILNIIGSTFDFLRRRLKEIENTNRLTYDKKNNISDTNIKNLLSKKGFGDIDLEINSSNIELWRTLLINSSYLWQSKGTRKSITNILCLLGIPSEIIKFNECVYVARRPLDVDLFKKIIRKISPSLTLADFNISSDGFPIIDKDMCFEESGAWIQEGTFADSQFQHIRTNKNNWIDRWRNLLPTFTEDFITETITKIDREFLLTLDLDTSGYTVEFLNSDGSANKCIEISATTDFTPIPQLFEDNCGCDYLDSGDTVLNICIENKFEQRKQKHVNVVANYWYDCNGDGTSILNIKPLGGQKPHLFFGAEDGQIVTDGQQISFYIEDFNGCKSQQYVFDVYCPKVLETDCSKLEIILEENCISSGTKINFYAQGGNGTYTYESNYNVGDLVPNGETINITVTDSEGCTTTISKILNCAVREDDPTSSDEPSDSGCDTIDLEICVTPPPYVPNNTILAYTLNVEGNVNGFNNITMTPMNNPPITVFNSFNGSSSTLPLFKIITLNYANSSTYGENIPFKIEVETTNGCSYLLDVVNIPFNPQIKTTKVISINA